ncbi:MAG: hypothetical protein P0107_02390 [Nitrosomonas sp.]|nr:hypothetical protein [Nitrosomonas sp.]
MNNERPPREIGRAVLGSRLQARSNSDGAVSVLESKSEQALYQRIGKTHGAQ